jgi:hypothetical protein
VCSSDLPSPATKNFRPKAMFFSNNITSYNDVFIWAANINADAPPPTIAIVCFVCTIRFLNYKKSN